MSKVDHQTRNLHQWIELDLMDLRKVDAETVETLNLLTGGQWTRILYATLLLLSQRTDSPYDLGIRKILELTRWDLLAMVSRSRNLSDRQRTFRFILTVSYSTIKSDSESVDIFNGAGDWIPDWPELE